MTTRFFIDSANRDDITALMSWGCFTGITTNPTIIREEALPEFMVWVAGNVRDVELHAQLRYHPESCLVRHEGDYRCLPDNLDIVWKCGCNAEGLYRAMIERSEGDRVNITGIMSRQQALLALRAQPAYISVFAGRIRDMGYDVKDILTKIAADCHSHPHDFDGELRCTQLIVGSIRHPSDIVEAIDAGVDVVTAPPAIWRKMLHHPRTEQTLEEFFK